MIPHKEDVERIAQTYPKHRQAAIRRLGFMVMQHVHEEALVVSSHVLGLGESTEADREVILNELAMAGWEGSWSRTQDVDETQDIDHLGVEHSRERLTVTWRLTVEVPPC